MLPSAAGGFAASPLFSGRGGYKAGPFFPRSCWKRSNRSRRRCCISSPGRLMRRSRVPRRSWNSKKWANCSSRLGSRGPACRRTAACCRAAWPIHSATICHCSAAGLAASRRGSAAKARRADRPTRRCPTPPATRRRPLPLLVDQGQHQAVPHLGTELGKLLPAGTGQHFQQPGLVLPRIAVDPLQQRLAVLRVELPAGLRPALAESS